MPWPTSVPPIILANGERWSFSEGVITIHSSMGRLQMEEKWELHIYDRGLQADQKNVFKASHLILREEFCKDLPRKQQALEKRDKDKGTNDARRRWKMEVRRQNQELESPSAMVLGTPTPLNLVLRPSRRQSKSIPQHSISHRIFKSGRTSQYDGLRRVAGDAALALQQG